MRVARRGLGQSPARHGGTSGSKRPPYELIVAYHVVGEGEARVGEELETIKRVRPEKLRPWPFGTGLAVRDWLARRA
jgi:hypothetical protein